MPNGLPFWPDNDTDRETFADWQGAVASGETLLGFRAWQAAQAAPAPGTRVLVLSCGVERATITEDWTFEVPAELVIPERDPEDPGAILDFLVAEGRILHVSTDTDDETDRFDFNLTERTD